MKSIAVFNDKLHHVINQDLLLIMCEHRKLGVAMMPTLSSPATSAVVIANNLRCHQWRQRWHHDNSYDAKFIVTGSTGDCRNGNRRFCQWRQSWHHEKSQFKVSSPPSPSMRTVSGEADCWNFLHRQFSHGYTEYAKYAIVVLTVYY